MGVTDGTWGLVIPGSGRLGADGTYRIGPRAHACLREAARLAERRRPRVVVFTGWSPVGGRSEAEQMLDAWEGPEGIELVAEPTAAITAQNMSRSLPHLLERGVREVTVVCGLLHLPRVRYHFGGVYPRHGVSCSYARVRLASPASLHRRHADRYGKLHWPSPECVPVPRPAWESALHRSSAVYQIRELLRLSFSATYFSYPLYSSGSKLCSPQVDFWPSVIYSVVGRPVCAFEHTE